MSIQAPAPFHDGTFVLHNIRINGHKYSAWFGKDGVVFSAERFSRDEQKTFNVPLSKQKTVAEQLTRIGKRYTGRTAPARCAVCDSFGTRGTEHTYEGGCLVQRP